MYVTMAEIAKRAMEGGYGVTAPNVYDEYSVTAAISAAETAMLCRTIFFRFMVSSLSGPTACPPSLCTPPGKNALRHGQAPSFVIYCYSYFVSIFPRKGAFSI